MADTHYDVIIAGGAAVGSAAAYFLTARHDFNGSVLVLEKDFSYQYSATALSAASIRHQFSTPENIRMSQFGTQFLRELPTTLAVGEDRPDIAFHEGGYLFLASDAGMNTLKKNHQTQKSCGVDVALLDPAQLAKKFPWLNIHDLAGGSLGLSGEGWLDAYSMMCVFRKKAVSQGAQYSEHELTDIHRQDHRITSISLNDGTRLECGTLINAAGTAGAALAQMAGIALPVQSRKRCVFYIQCPEPPAACPLVVDPSGAYFRPEGKGFICGISPPQNQDPECTDFDVQHALFDDVLWPLLAKRVPAFEALRCSNSWAGHYDMNTIDQNLIIGPHPTLDNMLFANGFSGHGLQQAPAVGRALSELAVTGRYETLDLSRMGWTRILNKHPLIEKNIV